MFVKINICIIRSYFRLVFQNVWVKKTAALNGGCFSLKKSAMTKEQNLYVAYEWQVFYKVERQGNVENRVMFCKSTQYVADLLFCFALNYPKEHRQTDLILKVQHAVSQKVVIAMDLNNPFEQFTAEQINEMPLPPNVTLDLDFGEGVGVMNLLDWDIYKRLK